MDKGRKPPDRLEKWTGYGAEKDTSPLPTLLPLGLHNANDNDDDDEALVDMCSAMVLEQLLQVQSQAYVGS